MKKTIRFAIPLVVVLTLVGIFSLAIPNVGFGYNKSWDQGHICVNPSGGDSGWGKYDYEGVFKGNYTSKECCELYCKVCPVYARTGEFQKTYTDLSLEGVGPSLNITRTYLSQEWSTSLFGRSWIFKFGKRMIVTRNKDNEKIIGIVQNTGEKNFFRENPDASLDLLADYGVQYELVKKNDGSYAIYEFGGTLYDLKADGKIDRIEDKNGNVLQFEYNEVGCLTRITNASGNFVDFQLGPNGKITGITDNFGRTVTYGYDEEGNLVSVSDPMGNTTQYTYNDRNLLTKVVDSRGNTTYQVGYSSENPPRVSSFVERGEPYTVAYFDDRTEKTDSGGNTWTYYFNDLGIIERVVDPLGNEKLQEHNKITSTSLDWEQDANGNRTRYTYDSIGNMVTKTDPLGNTWTFTYVAGTNRIETETNPLGIVQKFEYDSRGNLAKLIWDFGGPLENTISYTYDEQGRQTSTTDSLGNNTNYEYSDWKLVKAEDPLGNFSIYSYDARGNMLTRTDAAGNEVAYAYDLLDRVVSMTDPKGNEIRLAYDPNGNLTSVATPDGNLTAYGYDEYHRLTQITDPLGNTETYAYDHNNKLLSITDANGNTTRYDYNAIGKQVRVTNAENNTVDLEYDANGNLTAITDANGNATHYEYDSANQLIKETYPDGTSCSYAYDSGGRIVSRTDQEGNEIRYSYDRLDRKIRKTYPDETAVDYTYDLAGRTLSQLNDDSVLSYSYDAAGRTTRTVQNGKIIEYSYDSLGNRISMTTPEGETVRYFYDETNLMTRFQMSNGKGISYEYDSLGRVVKKNYPGGSFSTWDFDDAGRIARIDHFQSDGTLLHSQEYTPDNAGNILAISTDSEFATYSYDRAYRLTGADYPTRPDETFSYDPVGNRLNSIDYDGWNYSNRNELISYGSVSFAYDENGNTVSKTNEYGTTSYTYNFDNRLVRIDLPGGEYAEYKYDEMGRRIRKNVNGNATTYVYDGIRLLAEYDSSGAIARNYFYGADPFNPSMLLIGGSGYSFLKDHLDATKKLIDEDGTVVWSGTYSGFGEVSAGEQSVENNFYFPGQYYDSETGLHYSWNRYFAPCTGRFMTPDPIGIAGGINRYVYAGNNPVNAIDPWGLLTLDDAVESLKKRGVKPENQGYLWDSYSDAQKFEEWIRLERSDNAWLKNLPDCPCSTDCIDDEKWGELTDSLHGYHVGANRCMRSKPSGGHANQCCYDSSGKLLTGGSGIGSADFAPGTVWTFLDHRAHDMQPADLATKLDNGKWGPWSEKYISVRPQMGTGKCPDNPTK